MVGIPLVFLSPCGSSPRRVLTLLVLIPLAPPEVPRAGQAQNSLRQQPRTGQAQSPANIPKSPAPLTFPHPGRIIIISPNKLCIGYIVQSFFV